MNQNQTKSKPQDVEEPRDEGLDETTCSVIFAVSNDGGKTGVAWRKDVHDALAYLDLQNAGGRTDYCVVAVRKSPQNADGLGRRTLDADSK